jgi:hypothetical protein
MTGSAARSLTPPEHAGAYVFRSIDVLLQAGLSLGEIKERHAGMVKIAMDIRSDQYRKAEAKMKDQLH